MKATYKLLVTLVLLCCLVLPTVAMGATWADEDIAFLVKEKVMTKAPEDINKTISRQDFFVLVAKSLYAGEQGGDTLPFKDAGKIKSDNLPYLQVLYKQGILKGNQQTDGLYMYPEQALSRQEMATVLARAMKVETDNIPSYTDLNSIADYALPYVAALEDRGIISGYPDGSFKPVATLTWGESASLVSKLVVFEKLNQAKVSTVVPAWERAAWQGAKPFGFALPQHVMIYKGDVLVADTYNAMLRRINAGKVIDFAGYIRAVDEYGYAQPLYTDGAAAKAQFGRPAAMVADSSGKIYIADAFLNVIRVYDNGNVTTLAGNRAGGYANAKGKEALFNQPQALAMDNSGNLYVADTANHCIRKIDKEGNVTLVAGTPKVSGNKNGSSQEAQFNQPQGLAVGANGALYIADTGNNAIKKLENGVVTTVAGGNQGYCDAKGSAAKFDLPRGLTIADGLVFVADSGNNAIRVIKSNGQVVTVAGSGESSFVDDSLRRAGFNQPQGVAYANGKLYVADTFNNAIRVMKVDLSLFK